MRAVRPKTPRRVSAAETLRLLIDERGWTQERFSKVVLVSQALVSRWLSGARRPSLEKAILIERALDIPVSAWRPDPR